MKHKRFSEEQIIGVLKEQEAGGKVDDICRRHTISTAGDAKRLRELEAAEADRR